jgi:hypothetical protein
MRGKLFLSGVCAVLIARLCAAAEPVPASDPVPTACVAEYGGVKVSFYMDNSGFYHLYFHNEKGNQVYITATYNGNAYNCRLAAGGSQDFTLGKANPDPALLSASYVDE